MRCSFPHLHRGSAGASRRWMQQQSQDAFVGAARRQGYIARSAFKLTYLDDRFGLFAHGSTRAVVDLGCSPGGWCQVIRERCGDQCIVFGVDLLPMKASLSNAVFLTGDFTAPALQEELLRRLDGHSLLPPTPGTASGRLDVVTSDMCPNRMGGTQDRQRILMLNQQALGFALPLLRTGGHFVCKVLGSKPSYEELHRALGLAFLTTHICKPPASRQSSDEAFLVGLSKLAERRKGSINGQGQAVLLGNAEGGGRYGLDDWPGFARTPSTRGRHSDSRNRAHGHRDDHHSRGGQRGSQHARSRERARDHRLH